MLKNIFIILLFSTLLGITSCSDQSVITVEIPRYDSTIVYTHSLREEFQLPKPDQAVAFNPYALCVYKDRLYIGDRASKTVYEYDLLRRVYTQVYTHNERTDPLSLSVNDEHVYVACGDYREVQIFDRASGRYLTRLGTGVWSGAVSFATSLAQSEDYVFVRDSKVGVRVFDKKAINWTAVNNNSYYLNLDIDELYTPGNYPANPYDMEVLGDSLYVNDISSARTYIYSMNSVKSKETGYTKKIQYDKSTQNGIAYVMGMETAENATSALLFLRLNGVNTLGLYSRKDLAELNWSNPNLSMNKSEFNNISPTGSVALFKDQIVYPVRDRVSMYSIHKDSVIILSSQK
ncbi:MAG: YncE family protein [Bacteroidales bacterium]